MIVTWLFRRATPRRVNSVFRSGQLVSAAFYSLGHGGNDAQKTMGIIFVLLIAASHGGKAFPTPAEVPIEVVLACHLAMGMGTLLGGWRIVKTMGQRIIHLRPIDGFCAESGAAITLIMVIFGGIPVSTTHTISGAIIGVGSLKRLTAVRWGVVASVVWAWVLTIPTTAVLACILCWLFRQRLSRVRRARVHGAGSGGFRASVPRPPAGSRVSASVFLEGEDAFFAGAQDAFLPALFETSLDRGQRAMSSRRIFLNCGTSTRMERACSRRPARTPVNGLGSETEHRVASPRRAERLDNRQGRIDVAEVQQHVRKQMHVREPLVRGIMQQKPRIQAKHVGLGRLFAAIFQQVRIPRERGLQAVVVQLLGPIILERLGMDHRDVVTLHGVLDDDLPVDRMFGRPRCRCAGNLQRTAGTRPRMSPGTPERKVPPARD